MKRKEEQEAEQLEKREGIKKTLQLLNDQWFRTEAPKDSESARGQIYRR